MRPHAEGATGPSLHRGRAKRRMEGAGSKEFSGAGSGGIEHEVG